MAHGPLVPLALVGALAFAGASARAADDPVLNRAFQDHIAYVATFAMPLVIEACSAAHPDYLRKAAPAYFRYVNARQDQIERGRLLTLAELAPGETLKAYREQVVASRLGRLQTGTPEQKARICEGALGMLQSDAPLPGEWPARPGTAAD